MGFFRLNHIAMIASALFIDGKLDRWFRKLLGKTLGFQLLRMQHRRGIVKRFDFRPVWAGNGIFEASISSRIVRTSEILIGRINFPDHLFYSPASVQRLPFSG